MTALHRLADPRWRPVWYGALAAAVLAVIVMTGAIFWLARPWPLAGLAVLAAVLAGAWNGTFTRHSRRHALPRHTMDWPAWETEPRRLAIEAPRPQEETLVYAGHSPDWAPRFEPHTEIIDDEEVRAGFIAAAERRRNGEPRMTPPSDPVVLVTDDPPAGKHEKPRAYLVHGDPEPYCSKCTQRHWRGEGPCASAVVDELITRRRGGHVQQAINDDLRAAGLKVYDGGEDEALESMWTRAMGDAIAAVEAARKP